MVNITLSLPEDLKKKMDSYPEFNWSQVARKAFATQIHNYERLQELTKDSRLTEKDAVELGRLVNKGLSRTYLKRWNLL